MKSSRATGPAPRPGSIITRFAPAPTGHLHLGHIVNAIYVWGVARACGPHSRVLIRIEDHDRHRSRAAYESAILQDLEWLGFVADKPFVRQSERVAVYETALGPQDILTAISIFIRLDKSVWRVGSGPERRRYRFHSLMMKAVHLIDFLMIKHSKNS